MRWKIELGEGPQDVTVTTEGQATPDGFARMNAELVADALFRPGALVLLDHTQLLVDQLGSHEVRAISDDFVENFPELRSAVVAIVAPTPIQFGLARMSEILAEPESSGIRVFYTRAEALDWLRQAREGADATT